MKALIAEWRDMRRMTQDLLEACSETDMDFTLYPDAVSPLWKQFRHIGRVQENYFDALETGTMLFDPAQGSFVGPPHKRHLCVYFTKLGRRSDTVMACVDPTRLIDWEGDSITAERHLVRLLGHETLHHGQLILSWRALGHRFPKSWEVWGEA